MPGKRLVSIILVMAFLLSFSRVTYADRAIEYREYIEYIEALTNTVIEGLPPQFNISEDAVKEQVEKVYRWAYKEAPKYYPVDSNDAVQEFVVGIYGNWISEYSRRVEKKQAAGGEVLPLSQYLIGRLKNCLRGERRHSKCLDGTYDDGDPPIGTAKHPAQPINYSPMASFTLGMGSQEARLFLANDVLSPEEKNLLRERFGEGWNLAELALVYDKSVSTMSRDIEGILGFLKEVLCPSPAFLAILVLVALKLIYGESMPQGDNLKSSNVSRGNGSSGKTPMREYDYVYVSSKTGKPRSLPSRHALPQDKKAG